MRKKTLILAMAGMMILALMAPAVSAANYPQNGQFIAFYDEDKLAKVTSSPDGGTTHYNDASKAADSLVRVTTRSTPDPEEWPQFMINESNVGYSPCDGLPANNLTRTTLNTTDPRSGDIHPVIGTVNPVIANDCVFAMTGYAGFDEPQNFNLVNLTCVDAADNITKWVFDMPRNEHVGSWSAPAYDYENDFVYAVSDNKLFCIDVSDGSEEWSFTTFGSTSCNGGPTVGGDYVFCSDWQGSGDGPNYYCLDKTNGDLKWVFNSTVLPTGMNYMTYAQATPAYESVGGQEYIYVAGWGYDSVWHQAGYIFKVDVSDGSLVWGDEESGNGGFCGSVSIDDDHAFVTSYHFSGDGLLCQYNKTVQNSNYLGELNNSVSIERTDATPSIDMDTGRLYVSGGWNGGPYGSEPPSVACYRTADLVQVWENYNVGMGGWTCSVAIGDGYAFVGKETGKYDLPNYCYNTTYALNAETGALEWFDSVGGATAAIANDKVYTTDNNGKMYIYS